LELRLAVLPLLVSIYCLFVGDFALGQSGTSVIHGRVTDPKGNLVAGVSVTLKGKERDFLRSQTSNDKGMYIFSGVPPGTYVIEAEIAGFKKLTIGDVRALVDAPTNVDLQLEIGEITISISVSARESETQINTQDATIGHNFGSEQITQ